MAENYDFFAPYVRVTLVTPGKARLPLWFGADSLKDADKFGYKDAPQVGGVGTNLAIVQSVEITQELGNYFDISVVCTPTFEDAIAIFESDALYTGETLIEVRYGYIASGGQLSTRVFVGQMGDPDFSIGEEITFTLKAHAVCQDSLVGSSTMTTVPHKGTRKHLIELLVAGSGEPKRDVTTDFKFSAGSYADSKLYETINLAVSGKSDQLVISELLGECGCEAYYAPDSKDPTKTVMRVLDWEARFGSAATKVFALFGFGKGGGRLGGDFTQGGTYPILGVSTQSKQVFIRGVTNGTIRPKVDDNKKSAPAVESTNVDDTGNMPTLGPEASKGGKGRNRGPVSAKLPGKAPEEAGGGGTLAQTGVEDFPTQRAANAVQEMDDRIKSGIQLSVESVGVPDLEPGAIVVVRGLGLKFSGSYSVQKVMHSIGDNGYTTRWDGINNAGYLEARDKALAAITKSKPTDTSLYPDIMYVAPTPQPATKTKRKI